MKKTLLTGAITACTLTLFTLGTTNSAQALEINFGNIPSSEPGDDIGDAFSDRFKLEVTQNTPSTVLFRFSNLFDHGDGRGTFIDEVYFEDKLNLLTGITPDIGNISINGVDYQTLVVNPDNLPQGQNILFQATESAEPDRSVVKGNQNAVQGGETLGIQFFADYAKVLSAITNGDLRIGIHVKNLPNGGGSDSYVAPGITPAVIPTPAAVLPGLMGMGAAVFRKKKQGEQDLQEA